MSYDGFYSELSSRGTANDALNQIVTLKDKVVVLAAEAEVSADRSENAAAIAEVKATEAINSAASALTSKESAEISETNAGLSAQQAAIALVATSRFCGVSAIAPSTRLDGSALQQADEWYNSVDKLYYSWNGTAWVALNSSAQQLEERLSETSDPAKGAGMIGWRRSSQNGEINSAGKMLSAQPVNPLEFYRLVVSKPDPSSPATWDWSPAVIAAATAANGGIVDGAGGSFRISNTEILATCKIQNITLKPYSSVTGGVLLTISGHDSKLDLTIDADGKGIGGVEVKGNRVTGSLKVSNVVGQLQALGGTQGALKLSGTDADISLLVENLLIGTSTNTSIPRMVTTDNTSAAATRNTFRAIGRNVQCGWVTTQDQVHCETLIIDGVMDNGIYHLQGSATAGAVRIRDCHDEPVVAKAGLHIDDLTVIDCNGFSSMSGETHDTDFSVGTYTVISNDPTKTYRPLTVRAANVNSKARIGVLQGKMYLTTDTTIGGIFQFEAGSVSELSVGEINLEVHYIAGSTKILANMSKLKSVNIGKLTIKFIDDTGTLTFADKIDFRLPPAIAGLSYVGEVFITSDSAEVRVVNAVQPLIQLAPNMEVSTTIGPYILQESASFPSPRIFVGTGVPLVGSWNRGDTIRIKAPFSGGVCEYTCITGGSPGIWRASKWIVGRGTTASRPALTGNDIGVNYLDNTLNANGKPIWWNGSAWVDALGATV